MQIYETMSSIKSKCKLGYVLLPRIHMHRIYRLWSYHQISGICFLLHSYLWTNDIWYTKKRQFSLAKRWSDKIPLPWWLLWLALVHITLIFALFFDITFSIHILIKDTTFIAVLFSVERRRDTHRKRNIGK